MIAFTQYDRLVRSKKAELEEDGETDPVVLDRQSKEDATTAYVKCVTLVKRMIELRLKAQMPRYCKVSGILYSFHDAVCLLTARYH